MWEARSDTNWASKRSDPAKRSVSRSSRAQGAAQSSPNTQATRYFVGSSAHFFSKGEKSGRGFSWERGLPPHTTTDCPLGTHPPKLLHFPLRKQDPWETEDISPHLVFQLFLFLSEEAAGSFPAAPVQGDTQHPLPQQPFFPKGMLLINDSHLYS